MLCFVKLVSSVEESLGWDAANIKASTAKSTSLFDLDCLKAALTSLYGSNIATWTTTDDSYIVLTSAECHA